MQLVCHFVAARSQISRTARMELPERSDDPRASTLLLGQNVKLAQCFSGVGMLPRLALQLGVVSMLPLETLNIGWASYEHLAMLEHGQVCNVITPLG